MSGPLRLAYGVVDLLLKEGGYEGGGAMIYYGRPGPFAPAVEELVHAEVRTLIGGAK